MIIYTIIVEDHIHILFTMASHTSSRHLSTILNTSRSTIKEMLTLRGYDSSSCSNDVHFMANGDGIEPIKLSKHDENIEIHYDVSATRTNHKKLSSMIIDIIDNRPEADKGKFFNIIILIRYCMTPSVREAIRILNKRDNIFVQVFQIRSLMFNVTKHKCVPKHERIIKGEYSEYLHDFLNSLHINDTSNLPKIIESDPVAMFIGLRPGDLCKITRPSKSAGKHTFYRYCVPDK